MTRKRFNIKRTLNILILIMSATILNAQGLTDWHCQDGSESKADSMLIRISEIEVYHEYLNEYLTFAKNVGAESVRREPGVICIYPMLQQRDSCQIRILEIYANQEANQSHLQTPHFQTYKQSTLHMVKSLDLLEMRPMNAANKREQTSSLDLPSGSGVGEANPKGMWEIFKKMK